MEIKLTESGLSLFGIGGDQSVKNVHNDRAYILMCKGYANKDRSFMEMYEKSKPKIQTETKPEEGPVVESKQKPELKPGPKKEKAISKRADAGEKAVKK